MCISAKIVTLEQAAGDCRETILRQFCIRHLSYFLYADNGVLILWGENHENHDSARIKRSPNTA